MEFNYRPYVITTTILLLSLVAAFLRWLIYRKQKSFLLCLADLRTNFVIGCLIFGIIMIVLGETLGEDKLNVLTNFYW